MKNHTRTNKELGTKRGTYGGAPLIEKNGVPNMEEQEKHHWTGKLRRSGKRTEEGSAIGPKEDNGGESQREFKQKGGRRNSAPDNRRVSTKGMILITPVS